MKTLKTVLSLCLLLLIFSCSSDDDSSSGTPPTTLELLTSGKWYYESKTPGDYSDCEKNGSFDFKTDGTLTAESYDDGTGSCELTETNNATYTLSGSVLTITFGSENINATIDSISTDMMTITDSMGDVVVFDKIQG